MKPKSIINFGLLLLPSVVVYAELGQFHDYAQVIDVEPIVEISSQLVEPHDCAQQDDFFGSGLETDRFTTQTDFAATIGKDVRRQNRLNVRHRQGACGREPKYLQKEQIVGYRVTYRYRGKTLTRRMREAPGDELPVKVRVRALP